jgi:CubicO group peptidase (beta-lactamase class C family)
MNSPLWLIPLLLWLLLAGAGLVCVGLAAFGLRKTRAPKRPTAAEDAEPPVLSGGPQPAVSLSGCRSLVLKGLAALGLGAMVMGCVGAWSTRPSIAGDRGPVPVWSDGRAPELEPLIRKRCVPFISRGKSVGMAVALVTPTNATIMTFGRPALNSSSTTRADTLFEIGSITKTFTALSLAREIEHGAVRLEQPVQELLPPGVRLPPEGQGMTLRHLTTHSSGLPRVPEQRFQLRGLGMLLFGSDPYAGYTAADLLADVRTVKLTSKPGTQACYSNFGMTLLGYLLSLKAGSSYEALVKREVCLPLDMRETTITLSRSQASRVAQGYRTLWRCGPIVLALRSAPWFTDNDLGGCGALRSTASDMLQYLQANMHPEGQPLEQALRKVHEELFKEDEVVSYGMNWVLVHNQRLKQRLIWHDGGTGGFRSFIGFTGDRRFGVVVLSNSSEDVDDLAVDLLRDLAAPPAGKDRVRPRADSGRLASIKTGFSQAEASGKLSSVR